MSNLTLGTRGSELALAQAHTVRGRLEDLGHAVEIVVVSTRGDRILDRPLPEIGGKGLFTFELEEGLRDGTYDLAVHSLKDLPVEEDSELPVVAVLERAPHYDVLILPEGETELPHGATVGTSSTRRRAMLRRWRSDLQFTDLRGNVPTRIRRVDEGTVDATVLAEAGLVRLGLGERAGPRLEPPDFLPAPGQGAIAIQCKADGPGAAACVALDHAPTRARVWSERAVLEAIGGGCSAPLGALAVLNEDGTIAVEGALWTDDGAQVVRATEHGTGLDVTAAVEAGRKVGRQLRQGIE